MCLRVLLAPRERERERGRWTPERETQRCTKEASVTADEHKFTKVFHVTNALHSCALSAWRAAVLIPKCQWCIWSITPNQAQFVSCINTVYKAMNNWNPGGYLCLCHSRVLFRLLTLERISGEQHSSLVSDWLQRRCHVVHFSGSSRPWLEWKPVTWLCDCLEW